MLARLAFHLLFAASQVFLYPAGLDGARVTEKVQAVGEPRVFTTRNSKLEPAWQATKNKLFAITARSVQSMIRTQGIGDLNTIYLQTQRDGLEFNLAYIPSDFQAAKQERFDPEYMSALFDRAYSSAEAGYPWRQLPLQLVRH